MKIYFNKETKRFSVTEGTKSFSISLLMLMGGLALAGALSIIFKKSCSLWGYLDELMDGYDSGRSLGYDCKDEYIKELINYEPFFMVPKLTSNDKKTLAEINLDNYLDYYGSDKVMQQNSTKFDIEFEKFVYGKDFFKQLEGLIKSGKKVDEITVPTEDGKSTLNVQIYDCGKYGKLHKIHKDCGNFFEFKERLPKVKDAIGFGNEVTKLIIVPALNDSYLRYKNDL